MVIILKKLGFLLLLVQKIVYRVLILPFKRAMLKKCGKNCFIGKSSSITYKNVSVGNNVSIGKRAEMMATRAEIVIGNEVMIGPGVTIVTGDHRIDLIGRYMRSVGDDEKLPDNDKDVVIEDDVWIGCNVTILKGCHIGKGSVIAAGAVCINDIPNYAIVAGVPAKVVRFRFDKNEIEKHERILYGDML